MDFAHGGDGSSDEVSSNPGKGNEQFHRHSAEQIEQLEAFFKDCTHPTKEQRQQLSTDLGLLSRQIKFWFQNKRNQMKSQNEREENDALLEENQKLYLENYRLRRALMNPFCPKCDGRPFEDDTSSLHLQALHAENAKLKEELDGLVNLAARLRNRRDM